MLVSGGVQPDRGTRRLVKRLSEELELPVFILTDAEMRTSFRTSLDLYPKGLFKLTRWLPMPLTMKVRDIMESDVVTIDGNLTAKDALKKMLENNVWSVVVTVGDIPSGVVTERDLMKRIIAKNLNINKVPLKEIMSCPLITVNPDAPFGEAWKIMVEKGIRRLYVVEHGKIIGRVTQTGMFNKLLDAVLALASIKHLM